MKDNTYSIEKIALLALAAVAIGALLWIALKALKAGSIDPNASALIGVIVTGLIAVTKDIFQAVRGYASTDQIGKMTDQLAASNPLLPPKPLALPAPDAAAAADLVVDAAAQARDELVDKPDERVRAPAREAATVGTEIME